MDLSQEQIDLFTDIQAEVMGKGDEILIVCPKMPDEQTKQKINALFPDRKISIEEGIRPSIGVALQLGLQAMGAYRADMEVKGHYIKLLVDGAGIEEHPMWEMIRDMLQKEPFIESFSIIVNGQEMIHDDKKAAEAIKDNVERDHAVTDEDISNIHIDLGRCKSIDEFLEMI